MAIANHLAIVNPAQYNLVNLDNPTTIQTITNTICKGASPDQLQSFLMLAKHFNLNPFNKEIYFSSQIGVFVGRHGKLRIANRHPDYRGLISCEIREKDEFLFDAAQNKIVKHVTGKNMGKIIGAWATVKRLGFDDVTVICWLDEYKKSNPAWTGYTQDMIKYKAEDRALRTLFNSEFEGIPTVDPEQEYIDANRPTFEEELSKPPALITDVEAWLKDEEPENKPEIKSENESEKSANIRFQEYLAKNGIKTVALFKEFTQACSINSEQIESLLENPESLDLMIQDFINGSTPIENN